MERTEWIAAATAMSSRSTREVRTKVTREYLRALLMALVDMLLVNCVGTVRRIPDSDTPMLSGKRRSP